MSSPTRTPRFLFWVVMSIISCVIFLHQATTVTLESRDTEWAIAILSISLIFSVATTIAYLVSPEICIGSDAEGAATILLLLAWATGIPVLLGPKLPWV